MSFFIPGLLLVFLFMLSSLFSGTETALFSLTKIDKKRIRDEHAHLGKVVLDHLEHPRRTLTAILIGNLLVNTLAASMVTLMSLEVAGPGGAGVAVILFTIALIFLGEIIPKTLAVRHNIFFALFIAVPLRVFSFIIFPLRWLTLAINDLILSYLVKHRKEETDKISEEELKTLVKIGEEEGVLDSDERRMIHKVFELGERPVKEIMTHRVDLKALDVEDPHEEHTEIVKKHHFAYFPVYEETIDNVLGIVSAQEYMLNPDADIKSILAQPLIIPETKRIDEVLSEFRKQDKNFAVCVDEHGGVDGIVTLEDILEEIFGEFYDEYETVQNPIRRASYHEFIVEAKIAITDFNEFFDSNVESEEASTLGGFIVEKLGKIPLKGDSFEFAGFSMRICDVIRERRIKSVIVKRIRKEEEE